MKSITFVLSCLMNKIKKYFFNDAKTDISHKCESFLNQDEIIISDEEIKCAKEYMENYNVTTRWQTV